MGETSNREIRRKITGRIVRKFIPRFGYRWKGKIWIKEKGGKEIEIPLPGSIAQWLNLGETIEIEDGNIYKYYNGERIKIWPVFKKEYLLEKKDPLTGNPLYKYKILVREAIYERDFYEIVNLEQYHYASKKELVAIWYLPDEKKFVEANIRPSENAVLVEIKGSLPVSRFLILELLNRQPFEPRIVGYVRVDPPIPLVHRRIELDGNTIIEPNIREKIFPKDWFYPTYWPEALMKKIVGLYKKFRKTKSKRLSIKEVFESVRWEAIKVCNTSAARISRVVIHPDYRGDGLGMLAVRSALEWISLYRIPEIRKKKHIVETIAQMARYNPFFEKVGFKYLFDTKSGRPYLAYPLTQEAEKRIKEFLERDPYASKHKGKLYTSKYKIKERLGGPIILKNVTKIYETELDLSGLPEDIQKVLKAFGVEKRIIQRYILKNVNLRIEPGEIVVIVGISGAGKTTLLRMILGKSLNIKDKRYLPDQGEIIVPKNIKVAALLPGELEPKFERETILEHMYRKLKDITAAIEVLNYSGLSDAVFYRAKFQELSTGQKERAKIASLLAERPNVIIIDEFCAHLDILTAQKVTRKLVKIAREQGITLILVTHKKELIDILNPDKIVYVGYGGIIVKEKGSTESPS